MDMRGQIAHGGRPQTAMAPPQATPPQGFGGGLPLSMSPAATGGLGNLRQWSRGGPQFGRGFGRGITSLTGGTHPRITQFGGNFYGMGPNQLAGQIGIPHYTGPSNRQGIIQLLDSRPSVAPQHMAQQALNNLNAMPNLQKMREQQQAGRPSMPFFISHRDTDFSRPSPDRSK